MQLMYDVVIAGAGTGGAYAAYLLSKRGFKVALLESKSGPQLGVKVCGDGLGKHHVERMSRYLTPNPTVFSNVIKGVELFSPDMSVRYIVAGEGYVLDRFEWGKWLIREAVNAGAELYEAHTVMGPILESGAVVGVKARDHKTGSVREFRAKLVIDASGSAGSVRTKLPEEWPISERLQPEDVSHAFREVAEVEVDVEAHEYIKIYLSSVVAPGGYWWIFPRAPNIINVGLGIWGKLKINPVDNYKKHILPLPLMKGRKVIHAGGGYIPTRRPLKSLVANGILAVGDAAAAVNPIHGGGIGQALLSAELAAEAFEDAAAEGRYDAATLWRYNVRYMHAWGYRQAQLDVFRLMLQTLSDEELNYGLSRKLLTEDEIYQISARGIHNLSLLDKFRIAIRFMGRPSVLAKLATAIQYAKEIGDMYLEYPEDPSGLPKWNLAVVNKFNEFRRKMGLGPLPL